MMISSRFTRWLTLFALAATVAVALPARANTWPLPPAGSNVVGENRFHVVENDGGSLEAIAKKYNVGFLALLQANPGVDPYVPRAGSVLTIPLQTILPDAPRQGIVINLAELRLYLISALVLPGPRRQTFAPVIKLKVSTFLPWCLLARIIRWGTMRFAWRHTVGFIFCTERMRISGSGCASAPAAFACAMTISKRSTA